MHTSEIIFTLLPKFDLIVLIAFWVIPFLSKEEVPIESLFAGIPKISILHIFKSINF
jgi:hypothetical protein